MQARWPNLTRRPFRLMLITATLAIVAGASLSVLAAPHGGMGPMMGGPHFERMLDAVNASAEQKAQVRQIMETARADLKADRDGGAALREQSMQLFAQPTVDARAAESLRQQMLAQHDRASKRMLQAMLDVSRVLTPEQRAQMVQRMQQHRAQMEQRRAERGAPDRN